MKEQNVIGKILSGIDGMPSSKRTLMLWIGIVLWSFVHVMVFFMIKPFPTDIASTVILYDVILILSLGGMNVSERIWGKGKADDEPVKPVQ
jgi:hypothetical protein